MDLPGTIPALVVEETTVTGYGGRAVCPVDEYDDPEIRQEMVLHAVEEAFADAGYPPPNSGVLLSELLAVADVLEIGAAPVRLLYGFGQIDVRAVSDSHLGEDAAGLVDLTATLSPV